MTVSMRPTAPRPWLAIVLMIAAFSFLWPYSLHNRDDREHGLEDLKTVVSGKSSGIEEGHTERRAAVIGLALVALGLVARARRREASNADVGRVGSAGIDRSLAFPVIALVLFASASPLWGDEPALVARRVFVFLTTCFAAWAVARAWRLSDILLFIMVGCGATLLVSLGLEIGHGAFQPSDPTYRLSGLAHPNTHAVESAMLIMSSLTAARLTPSHRRAYLAVAAAGTVLLFLTRSRTAVLSVMAALACSAYFVFPRRKAVGIAVTIVAAALIVGVFVSNPLDSAKGALLLVRQQGQHADVGALTGRVELWKELLTYVDVRPLAGYGFDSFWSAQHTTSVSVAEGWLVPEAHNGYLDMLLSLGAIGLTLFVTVLVAGVWHAIRLLRIDRGNVDALFTLTVLVWVMVETLSETIIPNTHYGAFLAMVLLAREALAAPRSVPARAYVPVERVAVSA